MGKNIEFPSEIQAKVNEIMAGAKSRFGDGTHTMTLGTDVAPETGPDNVQTPPPGSTGQGETVFTKADLDAAIEKARQQEKDKLYGRIDTLTNQMSQWEQERQERQQAEEAERQRLAEEARRAEEEGLSAKELLARKEQEWEERLNTTQQTLEQRLASMQQEREEEQALLAREREFSALQQYRTQALAAAAEDIAPQFHDFITGSTQAEIDQSIEVAKAKSAEVAQQVQAALQAARQQQRGASITGFTPSGPVEVEGGTKRFTAEDIQNMSPAEYAKNRHLLIGNGAANNRGLFG